MRRLDFLRNLIALPIVGKAIFLSNPTVKESLQVETRKFSIPAMSHDEMQAIKNPFNGQLL